MLSSDNDVSGSPSRTRWCGMSLKSFVSLVKSHFHPNSGHREHRLSYIRIQLILRDGTVVSPGLTSPMERYRFTLRPSYGLRPTHLRAGFVQTSLKSTSTSSKVSDNVWGQAWRVFSSLKAIITHSMCFELAIYSLVLTPFRRTHLYPDITLITMARNKLLVCRQCSITSSCSGDFRTWRLTS